MTEKAENTFGARLKALRDGAGLSQQQLASRAGLAVSTVSKLERRLQQPTWDVAIALADALGVQTDEFRGERP